MDHRIRRQEILRGHGSFSRVLANSRVFSSNYFKLYVSFSGKKEKIETKISPLLNNLKVGFIISKKKIKKAVHRNYLKRILREVYRLNKNEIYPINANEMILTFNLNAIQMYLEKKFPSFTELNEDFKILTESVKSFNHQ